MKERMTQDWPDTPSYIRVQQRQQTVSPVTRMDPGFIYCSATTII